MKIKFDIADFVKTETVQSVAGQLAEREKSRRKTMQISQKSLAEKSGVSYASVRRFEGTGEISLNSLLKIAGVLGCLEDFTALFKPLPVKSLKDFNV